MKKNPADLETARENHQAGRLNEAKKGYLAILRVNPRDADVLHSLGVLYAQQENFSDAIDCLKKAVTYQPDNPTLQLHLANMLKLQGMFTEAANVLQQTLKTHPDYVPALNNLGSLYYSQAKFPESVAAFRQAIVKKPDYIDAYYNLGLTLMKQENAAEAERVFAELLERSPQHHAARFQYGCVLMQQNKIPDAIKQFLIIEDAQSSHFETESNLATCYLKQGALKEAKNHYLKALKLRPQDSQILFNLGVIHMQLGQIDTAIEHYQKAIYIEPNSFAAQNNLGVAFLARHHIPYALQHFQQALRLQPDNQAIAYTVTMLSKQQNLAAAPVEYIRSLFDAYADHYEPHLLNTLNYQVPKLLLDTVRQVISLTPSAYDILDLGCGTGLCGVTFKPYAKTLTGVDLSEKMLQLARQKNVYDKLENCDLIQFVAQYKNTYDLVLAGDVLVYVGDLATLFPAVSAALRTNGCFAFNTEICTEGEYKLNPSGRFTHSKNYLERLAAENHLSVRLHETVTTRLQNDEPVRGYLYVLQKGA